MFKTYDLDPIAFDNVGSNDQVFHDLVNFNDIASAGLLIFQVLTLEGWSDIMYNYMDTSNSFMAACFFIMVVIFGAFVSLNLVLAQIMHSFLK